MKQHIYKHVPPVKSVEILCKTYLNYVNISILIAIEFGVCIPKGLSMLRLWAYGEHFKSFTALLMKE